MVFTQILFGTDSHTDHDEWDLGVLGWGVGGIEAEAAILGEASYFPMPEGLAFALSVSSIHLQQQLI